MSAFIPMLTSPGGESEVMCAYQAIMDKWPVPYKELTISTSFGETWVIASGPENGPPVVLIHALLAASASWYRNVDALSQIYRVYAVDVVGEGNKSHPVKPITSLDDFLQWFTEVIDGLGIGTLYLVGNSYGGFTAAYYAMKLRDRIRKLVLIGPASTYFVSPSLTRLINASRSGAISSFNRAAAVTGSQRFNSSFESGLIAIYRPRYARCNSPTASLTMGLICLPALLAPMLKSRVVRETSAQRLPAFAVIQSMATSPRPVIITFPG